MNTTDTVLVGRITGIVFHQNDEKHSVATVDRMRKFTEITPDSYENNFEAECAVGNEKEVEKLSTHILQRLAYSALFSANCVDRAVTAADLSIHVLFNSFSPINRYGTRLSRLPERGCHPGPVNGRPVAAYVNPDGSSKA